MSLFLPAQNENAARRRKRITAALLAVALGLALGAGPAWKAFERLRVRKWVAEGEAYLAQNRVDDALESALKARRAGASDLRSLHLLLRTLGAKGAPEAITIWTKVAEHPSATPEHRRDLLKWALAWGREDLGESQWAILVTETPRPFETLRLGAAFYELQGNAKRTVEYARAVLEQKPDDIETLMRLGRMLIRSASPSDQGIGKRLLLEQAAREDVWGVHSLRLLASSEVLDPFEATECRKGLRKHPRRDAKDILLEAELEWQVAGYKKDEIVGRASRDFLGANGRLVDLARWLTRNDRYQEVLKWVTEEAAGKSAELVLVRIDALGKLEKWSEIEKFLEQGNSALDPLSRALYLAHVSARQNQDRIAQLRWTQALELAGREANLLERVADYAWRSGNDDAAGDAADRLIRLKGAAGRRGYEFLLKMRSNDLTQTKEILERYLAHYPNDERAQADLAYARLLLDDPAQETVAWVEKLAREKPAFAAHRTALALARLRRGMHREARDAFALEASQWRELLPYQQAVYAATVAATGDNELAREIYRSLDLAKVRAEERRLVEKWL